MRMEEQKQHARKRRERKLQAWLTTLSWTTPAIAFGGFFTLWHDLSSTTVMKVPVKTITHTIPHAVPNAGTRVLMQVGFQGAQVSALQEQLAALGYFHHDITDYYGPITQAAVAAFQVAVQLPMTGTIDGATLQLLQQAVRQHHVLALTGAGGAQSTVPSTPSTVPANPQTTPSVGFGQANPVAITSAS